MHAEGDEGQRELVIERKQHSQSGLIHGQVGLALQRLRRGHKRSFSSLSNSARKGEGISRVHYHRGEQSRQAEERASEGHNQSVKPLGLMGAKL